MQKGGFSQFESVPGEMDIAMLGGEERKRVVIEFRARGAGPQGIIGWGEGRNWKQKVGEEKVQRG